MKGKVMRRLASVSCLAALVACASAPPVVAPSTPRPAIVIPVMTSYLDARDVVVAAHTPDASSAPEALVPQNVHRSRIVSLVADPRGRYVFAIDDDSVLSLHDAVTGRIHAVERTAIRRAEPPSVSLDLSGSRAVIGVSGSGSEPARTFAWDLGDGTLREIARTRTRMDAAPSAVIAPDGRTVVTLTTGAYDRFGATQLEVRDFTTGARVAGPVTIEAPRAVGISPSGKMIVVRTHTPDAVRMFDATTLEARGSITGITTDVFFNPRGGQLIVATRESLLAHSPHDGRVLGSTGVDASVSRLAFAPDGACFAAVGEDGATRLRRTSTFEVVHVARTSEVASVAVLPACAGLIVGTHTGELTRHRPGLTEAGETLAAIAPSTSSRYGARGGPLALVGDATRLAVGVGEDVVIVDATSGEERARAAGGAGEHSVWSARFSGHGEALYVSGRGYLDVWTARGARRTACSGPSTVTSFASGHVLIASPSGICDPDTGVSMPAYPIAMARDVPRVLVYEDQRTFVYDLAARSRGQVLLAPGTRDCPEADSACGGISVMNAAGTRVAITARDGRRIFVYDVEGARKIATLDVSGTPSAMHFTPDGASLTVVVREGARVFASRGGRSTLLEPFEAGARVITHEAGARYVVLVEPGARSVFDLETGERVLRIVGGDGLDVAAHPGAPGAFVTRRDDTVIELALATTGARIAMGERRFLGVSTDLTRMATCTGDVLLVTRLDVDAPPTPFGTCAHVDEVTFRADAAVLALRAGTRVVLRRAGSDGVDLRTVRAESVFTPFAVNARGELSFPQSEATSLCLRPRGPLMDGTCRNAPLERRVQSVLSPFFAP